MKIKTRLIFGSALIALVSVAIVSVLVGWVAISSSHSALELKTKDQLVSVRDMKKSEIERYFTTIRNQVLTFSNDRMMIDAMLLFTPAFRDYRKESTLKVNKSSLKNYYDQEFGGQYRAMNNGLIVNTSELVSGLDRDSVALQYAYIAANKHPLGSKDALDTANDGSSYSQLHQKFHPYIRDYLNKFGYYNIFLVDPDSGDIIYSVFKEPGYSTSLINGPYANSGIAEAFRGANAAKSADEVTLIDFATYTPSYEAPASFIASPIFDGGKKIGVLIFQIPVDHINAIMTHKEKWAESGLGSSGETYLVGNDMLMRSMSRFLIEDKPEYLQLMGSIGLNPEQVAELDARGTSIGLQSVDTQGTRAALSGKRGFEIFPDYQGIPVLSAYAPLEIAGLDWVIMSEIDEAEAFLDSDVLASDIIKLSVLLAGIVGAVAVAVGLYFAGTITRPLNTMVEMLQDVAEGKGDLTRKLDETRQDELGSIAHWFNIFTSKIEMLIIQIGNSTNQLSSAATQMSAVTEQTKSGVNKQRSQTDQVATSVNKMSAIALEVVQSALSAEQSAKQADEEAAQGGDVVTKTIGVINDLAQEVESAALVIHKLEEDSSKIGGVLSVIKGIAEQTNLLALNAAIEAARAGEQGRGFAVVADEVRTLASRTQDSTQEIETMISLLQQAAAEAVNAMEASCDKAKGSVEQAALAGASLDSIKSAVAAISDMNGQIASVAEQQSVVTEEINRNVVMISQIADETLVGANQTADSSGDLSKLAVNLQSLVKQFKVSS
ncbi:MAG: methyl-accepting chemotaxis protein [Gammaproteobacteria bacterium]|nr:methyl-accepting chemotaxis protein [Gammaproteobacteria bacterium]